MSNTGGVPMMDFSILGNLGNTYKTAQKERTLAELGKRIQSGELSLEQAAQHYIGAGDTQSGMSLARLADARAQRADALSRDRRDHAFRLQQFQQAQSNADRAHQFQVQQANRPEVVMVEDPSTGIKTPYLRDRMSGQTRPMLPSGPTPSTATTWGDREAEAAGLYEPTAAPPAAQPPQSGAPPAAAPMGAPAAVQPPGPIVAAAPPPPPGVDVKKWREKMAEEAAKKTGGASKAASNLTTLESQWKMVDSVIDRAMKNTGWFRTGMTGAATAMVPGSDAYTLARDLETIKANIGFDKLQSMRENSPTGGALGQVSDFENRLLQATQGSLDQFQQGKDVRRNLALIKQNLARLREERRKAFKSTYPGVDLSAGAAGSGNNDPLGIR